MNKIPIELYNEVYEFYTQHLDKGIHITKIANLFNKHFGTQFAESSLRNRFEFQRDINNVDVDIVERLSEVEEQERKLALAELKLISDQKKIQRQQSTISSQIRYNADKELVAEVFNGQERTEFNPVDLNCLEVQDLNNTPIFHLSDVHLGYDEQGYYDMDTAYAYVRHFFEYVNVQIKLRDLDEVIISDGGDQIEGSTLRATQLFNIAEVMTKQAVLYADIFTGLLEDLSVANPETHIRVYFVDEDNHSQIRIMGSSRGDTTEMLAKTIANDIRKTVETAKRYGGLTNITFYHAGEIFGKVGDKIVLWTHGHQYPKQPKQLAQKVFDIHSVRPDVIIHGHFHTYQNNTLNTYDDFMQTVISAPAIVGDTRYGKEGLGLTGLSGFIEVNIDDGVANTKFIKSVK